MVKLNNLNGFDLVYSVSQSTVNHQLELLYAIEVLPSTWKIQKGAYSVNADIGIPKINLNIGDASSRKAQLLLPLETGTFNYVKLFLDDNGAPVMDDTGNFKTQKVSLDTQGWIVTLNVNLSIAEIAQNNIANHKAIPEEVKKQLENFNDDMFDIQHLFLNFEDANLVDTFDVISNHTKLLEDIDFINAMKSLLKSFIAGLQKPGENPFILGFTVQDKKTPASNATFIPTGVTYSTYADAEHLERSSINYLLVTEGKTVPGAGYGIFTHNWINDDNIQGKFITSQNLILGQILPKIAEKLNVSPNDFKLIEGNAVTLTTANSYGGNTKCTISPSVNANQLFADFDTSFNKSMYDKAGSYIGYVDGLISSRSTITFAFNAKNEITVSVTNSTPNKSKKLHPNSLGEFEKFLANIADTLIEAVTLGFVNDIFNDMIKEDWTLNLSGEISTAMNNINQRIILPGGSKLLFKDIKFYNDGSLIVSTTYKN